MRALSTYSHLWPTAEDRTRAAGPDMLAEALADSGANLADSLSAGVVRPLTWANVPDHTLKRNSTTSPSAIT